MLLHARPVTEHEQAMPDSRQKKAGNLPAKYGSLPGKYSTGTVLACDCIYTRHPGSHTLM